MASVSVQTFLRQVKEKVHLDTLQQRERRVLVGGIAVVLCFVVLQFIVSPFLASRKQLHQSIERKEQELLEISKLRQEYLNVQDRAGSMRERLKRRPAGFSLFSFLDKQAATTKVKDLIKYMKPSVVESDDVLQESLVEMKLVKLTLRQLVNFIQAVESKDNVVVIRRISIQESDQEDGYLDAVLQIVTFTVKGK